MIDLILATAIVLLSAGLVTLWGYVEWLRENYETRITALEEHLDRVISRRDSL